MPTEIHRTPQHRLVDAKLDGAGHPPLRDLILGPLAAESWEGVARWVAVATGVATASVTIWEWFNSDTEVATARTAAKAAARQAAKAT